MIVIGGGIAGVGAAWALSEAGRTVALVEQEAQLAHHTTGRSAAVFLASYGPPVVRRLTAASRADYEAAPALLGTGELFEPRQAIWLATDAQLEELSGEVSSIESLRAISVDEALALCPVLRPEMVAGAAVEDHASDMDVLGLHQGFVRRASELGTVIHRTWQVVGITRDGDGWTVHTDDDRRLRGGALVLAAGAWCDRLGAMAGARPLGLRPLRRTLAVCPTNATIDPRGPLVHHIDNSYYWKPEGPNVLCSPADETPSEPCDARPEELDVALAIERINETTTLGLRSVRNSWAGLRTFSPDRVPVCGADPEVDGLWWLAGQGGYGIQTAPAMSRSIAALMTTGELPAAVTAQGLTVADLSPARVRSAVEELHP